MNCDFEHRLLSGFPIYIEETPTYKVTLGEMVELGYTKMRSAIGLICIDDEEVAEYIKVDNPSAFMLVVATILNEYDEIQNGVYDGKYEDTVTYSVIEYLKLVFRVDNVQLDLEAGGFVIGNGFILNEENYNNFRDIIKYRNCLIGVDGNSKEDNPADNKAKMLLEKRKKLREKIKKAKQDDDGIELTDLISIYADAKCMPLQDVYDNYDMFQFDDQFNRLKIMDDFHVNIQALLAGAEGIELKHWLSKINKEQDD